MTILLLSGSCTKVSDPVNNPLLQDYFNQNIINRDFTVTLASDNGTDLTSNYSGYTFVLLKTDFYHGPLRATSGSNTYTGSWSSNQDYSKLEINLPVPPNEFTFLNRAWRFTSKNFPTMKLAPWGSSDPIMLNMYRQ